MKYDYKKDEKDVYGTKSKPVILELPNQWFVCVDGEGNPNTLEFQEAIGVLYQISYAIKMMPKSGFTPIGYFDYCVFPLEGLWSLSEKGIDIQKNTGLLDKNEFTYTLMIKQPAFASIEVFHKALEAVRIKKNHPLLSKVYFKETREGLCCQILHKGSYDNEPISFERMQAYLEEQGYERVGLQHKEIYLSDARRSKQDNLKTLLRVPIESK